MAAETPPPSRPHGVGAGDVPGVMREVFVQCVEDARAQVDPAVDFDGFVACLWVQVSAAFGFGSE